MFSRADVDGVSRMPCELSLREMMPSKVRETNSQKPLHEAATFTFFMSYVHSWCERWACVGALFIKLAVGGPALLNVIANPFINSHIFLSSVKFCPLGTSAIESSESS